MNLPNEGESPKRGDLASGTGSVPKKLDDLRKSITMAQIAKAASVSQGAISSLLNDRDYGIRVSDKTRERVFRVCREMGYIPNDLRAVVRMYPELGDFCLLVADDIAGGLQAPRVARLASAAMGAVPDPSHPLTVAFYHPATDYLADGAALPQAIRAGVSSKFLVFGEANASLCETLVHRSLPVISLGYDAALAGVVSFVPDYAAAARLALEHLHDLGHRTFGIVSGPAEMTDACLLELHRGVQAAGEQLGLPPGAQDIIHGDLTEAAGRAALDELLARKLRPTAVFCLSDAAASGVLARAQALGLAVPGSLSVVGCGNEVGAEATHPQLTTVHLPIEDMAELGVQTIDRLVHDAPSPVPQKTLLPLRLVQRQSSAARKVS